MEAGRGTELGQGAKKGQESSSPQILGSSVGKVKILTQCSPSLVACEYKWEPMNLTNSLRDFNSLQCPSNIS